MRYVLAIIMLALVSCTTPSAPVMSEDSKVKDAGVATDAGVDAGTIAGTVITEFVEEGFAGTDWGLTREQLSTHSDLEGFSKLPDHSVHEVPNGVLLRGPVGSEAIKTLVVSFGFDNDRLVYGTHVFIPHSAKTYQIACVDILMMMTIDYGEPQSQSGGAVIWYNENSTAVLYCTNMGAIADWYYTPWLNLNHSFLAHRVIPIEVLEDKAPSN